MPISDAPRTAAGYMSDLTLYGNSTYLMDPLETVPALVFPENVRTFNQMRHDPQLSATMKAYTLPLLAGDWAVDPAGCRDEVVELVADGLGLPVFGGGDNPPGPARRRGVDWDDHLRLSMLDLVWGFMPFAQRYEIATMNGTTRAKLMELSERMPSTITAINVNDDGSLGSITQFGSETEIPAEHLLWYCHEREGSNWTGRSMLRPAYGSWLLKHEAWRILATSSRRFGAGTPVVEAPPGGTPAQVHEAERLASSIRVGDQGGAGLPSGFKLTLAGITGSVPDTLAFVRYLDQQMSQSVLASVLDLGSSPNGSRALGNTLVSLLRLSWNAVAKELRTVATRQSIQMVDYNWGLDEPAPRIVVSNLDREEATVQAVRGLIEVGAITPDPSLESTLRERLRLPAQIEEMRAQADSLAQTRQLVTLVRDLYLGVGTVLTDEEARQLLKNVGADIIPGNTDGLVGRPAPYQALPTPLPEVVDENGDPVEETGPADRGEVTGAQADALAELRKRIGIGV